MFLQTMQRLNIWLVKDSEFSETSKRAGSIQSHGKKACCLVPQTMCLYIHGIMAMRIYEDDSSSDRCSHRGERFQVVSTALRMQL